MQTDQKLPNNLWIAHDTTTQDVFNKTLRNGLAQCKLAYIKEHYLTQEEMNIINLSYINNPDAVKCNEEILDLYGDLIPNQIEFVIVTLNPRYETTVKGGL